MICEGSRTDTLGYISLIVFLWAPAHVGLEANEVLDKLAKQAVKHYQINIQVTEQKSQMKEFINNKWQEEWNSDNKGRQMYSIQKQVGDGRSVFRNRKEDTIISRIRIGHTRLNHSLFKIGKHKTGKCNYCNQAETIEHVLIKCIKYVKERLELMKEVRKLGVVLCRAY